MPFKHLRRSSDGIAALEFALILPLIVVLILSMIEYSHYSMIARRADMTTHMMAEFISRTPDDRFDWYERANTVDMIHFTNPNGKPGAQEHVFGTSNSSIVSFAPVRFEKVDAACSGSGCATRAVIDWMGMSGALNRSKYVLDCNLQKVGNTVTPTNQNIAEGLESRIPVIVVNAAYKYTPMFGGDILPSLTIERRTYRKARSDRYPSFYTNSRSSFWHRRCD